MNTFIQTVLTNYISKLNSAIAIKETEERRMLIIKSTADFYLKSEKYIDKLGLRYADKLNLLSARLTKELYLTIEEYDIKSPSIRALSQQPFYGRSFPFQSEHIFAALISMFSEIDYYKKNNLYPEKFLKDFLLIALLIKITNYFDSSADEEGLIIGIVDMQSYDVKKHNNSIFKKIDNYIIKKSEEFSDNDNVILIESKIADYIMHNNLASVDDLIDLLGIAELNCSRITKVISTLLSFEESGVSINLYLIREQLLEALLQTISDFPYYLDGNEVLYYDTVLRLAIVIRELYAAVMSGEE